MPEVSGLHISLGGQFQPSVVILFLSYFFFVAIFGGNTTLRQWCPKLI